MKRTLSVLIAAMAAGCLGIRAESQALAIGAAGAEVAPRLTMGPAMTLPGAEIVYQRGPAVAYGNGRYLIVWQDGFNGLGGESNILALRLSEDGKLLDEKPISVCAVKGVQDSPAVAFCGGRFLVLWSDLRHGADYDVYAAWVNPAGTVTPRDGFLLAGGAGGQANPAVAANGTDQFLAVWQAYKDGRFHIAGARISTANFEVLDKTPLVAMPAGERPVVTWTGKNYAVGQKWYAALVGTDGKVQMETKQLWNSKTVLLPCAAAAWDRAFFFFCEEPFQDPWGWGGNGGIVGVSLSPEGESPERAWAAEFRDLQAAEADNRVKNSLDAARWRNHPGWPMGMRGALKGTHNDLWPSGVPAACHNGRSLLVLWPRAHWVDNRRLRNRDLYLTRVLPDWGLVDRPAVKLVAGETEEANPVLAAGATGRALLAYEKVLPEGGVGVEYRLLTEAEDTAAPKVEYVVPASDTQLIVAFNEPVDEASGKAATFEIAGLAVKSAALNADNRGNQREILLETDPVKRGKTYTLRVTGLKDRSPAGNATAGAETEFVAQPGAFQRGDFIERWAVLGPLPRKVDEHPFDPKTVRPSPGDAVGDLRWADVKGAVLDLGARFEEKEGMAYAAVYAFSDRKRDGLLRLDTNDHNRAWLNGNLVHDGITKAAATRGFHDYSDQVPIALEQGWNALLLQVENRGGAWLMIGQITDARGEVLRDLTWQVEKP